MFRTVRPEAMAARTSPLLDPKAEQERENAEVLEVPDETQENLDETQREKEPPKPAEAREQNHSPLQK